MIIWLRVLIGLLRVLLARRRNLVLENLALRQQLAVLKQTNRRPRLTNFDRQFWVVLSKVWSGWQRALHIVQPNTVIRWHREGFRRHWASKTRRPGRPAVSKKIRALIRRMSAANPLWGAPRIHGELVKLGIEISEATVSKYLVRSPTPPSQSWRAFMKNHAKELLAIDFFTVPTASFRVLFVFVALSHDRRRIIHTNVTEFPNSSWAAQQVVEALGCDEQFRYLLRDSDPRFAKDFGRRVRSANLREVITSPGSPWQNPYVERVIGSIRRECTDHVIVLGERHLRRILRNYVRYYNEARTHLALGKDAPAFRPTQSEHDGTVRCRVHCGGLHHEYYRKAA